jgi:hypothetical protein
MVFLSILSVLGRLWMERAFEKSGVFEVVKALNGYKVMGLEGFSLSKSKKSKNNKKQLNTQNIQNYFHFYVTSQPK